MYNFKLKSVLGSIIVLGGLLLSACSGGSSISPASNLIENVLSSDNNLNNVTIGGATVSFNETTNDATVEQVFGKSVSANLTVKFATAAGTNVKLGGQEFTSGSSYVFNKDESVQFVVTAANRDEKIYTVTVKDYTATAKAAMPFAPYPAGSCILTSNEPSQSCECLQDTTTGDVWTRTTSSNNQCYNSLMSPNGTCDNKAGDNKAVERGYIYNLNMRSMCGFASGWNLPSLTQLSTMKHYVSDVPDAKRGDWFNQRGFSGIKNGVLYVGQCSTAFTNEECVLPSGTNGHAYHIYMGGSTDVYRDILQNSSLNNATGWGVHSGNK